MGGAPPVSTDAMKACPFCREQILANAVKCRHCGSTLMEPQRQPVEAKSQNGGVVVLGLLAVVGGVAYFATRGNESSDSANAGSSQRAGRDNSRSSVNSGAADSPPPISDYVGRDPQESVNGFSFLRHPSVVAGVNKALPPDVSQWIGAVGDIAIVPIANRNGWVVAHFCERRNCGEHQWSFLVAPSSAAAKVCYHAAGKTGPNSSWWYDASGQPEVHPGGCP